MFIFVAILSKNHFIYKICLIETVTIFQSNVAIYGRRSEPPTITNYDWVHMITEDGDIKTIVKVRK